jgi:hypothetical protein
MIFLFLPLEGGGKERVAKVFSPSPLSPPLKGGEVLIEKSLKK